MECIDVGSLLLVGSNERLQVRASLSLHILAHEDGTSLTPPTLNLEGRANDRETHLGLIHIGYCIGVRLLELAYQLLWVAGRSTRVTACIQVEPLLENS
jgi:hypothetical protein